MSDERDIRKKLDRLATSVRRIRCGVILKKREKETEKYEIYEIQEKKRTIN